ncbi:uncharacterized protein VTP21DRAFT_7580 [Calcarisporiella thermophila]|uniref:uncharacterized protein n=1 Tax=Calcarisporiella thermophila TaxID=911321 RepID=UPI0037430DA8
MFILYLFLIIFPSQFLFCHSSFPLHLSSPIYHFFFWPCIVLLFWDFSYLHSAFLLNFKSYLRGGVSNGANVKTKASDVGPI